MPKSERFDDRHECPKTGCTRMVRRDLLACRAHWQQVSRPTQLEVYALWAAKDQDGGLVAYMEIRRQAIAEMNHPDRKPAKQVAPRG